MPLIKCQKCKAIVNTTDDMCPNCGELFSQYEDRYLKLGKMSFPTYWILPAIAVIAVLVMLGYMVSSHASVTDSFLRIFKSTIGNFFNLAFFVIIVSLFSWTTLVFRRQVRYTRRALGEADKYIRGVELATLSKKFDDIDKKFSEDDFFAVQWHEFAETLKRVNEGNETIYYNTIDVSYFFNEDTLFFNRFLSSFIFSIPTLLTGIGIFGTFFGLVIGLQPFQYITDFTETAKINILTSQLLSGISTSFLSSLWGIFFSLVMNFILFHAKSGITNEIRFLTERLEAIFPRHLSVEGKDFLEIKDLIRQNSEIIKKLTDKIS
jgi:hypothetical protein